MSEISFNWLLQNTEQFNKSFEFDAFPHLRQAINQLFIEGRHLFGYDIALNQSGQSNTFHLALMLMKCESGFTLLGNDSKLENTIDPLSLVGAGEILPKHGHVPILMMVALQRKLKSEYPQLTKQLLYFCDEQGEQLDFDDFDTFGFIVNKFGFDTKQFFKDAVKLGLTKKLIELDEIDSEKENMFF